MLEIRNVPAGGDLRAFLDVVDDLYRHDPAYVRPLDQELKERLDPKKNPYFEHAEATIFTAHRGGRCVGRDGPDRPRAPRQVRRRHGFFGFLDTVDDPEVAKLLLVGRRPGSPSAA